MHEPGAFFIDRTGQLWAQIALQAGHETYFLVLDSKTNETSRRHRYVVHDVIVIKKKEESFSILVTYFHEHEKPGGLTWEDSNSMRRIDSP